MDQPLFGERKPSNQIAVYVFGGIVSAFVLFSLIVAIVKGIHEKEHFVLAVGLIMVYINLIILYKWYRSGELDPKSKYVLILLALTAIVIGVSINVYAWKKGPVIPQMPQCDGLYQFSTKTCFHTDISTCVPPNQCLEFYPSAGVASCVSKNCTTPSTSTSPTTGNPIFRM